MSMAVEYPPWGCTARARCVACPKFRCRRCGKQRPWCLGADGPHPEWCDICWYARHRKSKPPCRTCAAYERRRQRKRQDGRSMALEEEMGRG